MTGNLVKGGQGRDAGEVEASAAWVGGAFLGTIALWVLLWLCL